MSFVKQMKVLLPALIITTALALSLSLAPVYADDAPDREPQTHDITIMMDEIQQPEVGQPFPEPAVSQTFEAVQAGYPEGGVTGTDGFWQKESYPGSDDFQNVTDTVALPGTYRYCVTLSLDMTKKDTVEYIDDEDHPVTKETDTSSTIRLSHPLL